MLRLYSQSESGFRKRPEEKEKTKKDLQEAKRARTSVSGLQEMRLGIASFLRSDGSSAQQMQDNVSATTLD
jgi:hypothetical protein